MSADNCTLLRKEGESYCRILKREAANNVREGHFRPDLQGKYRINGSPHRPANIPESPDSPGPWRSLYGVEDWEGFLRAYEEDGWVRVSLDSFECPDT